MSGLSRSALDQLRAPFTAEAVKWKLQTNPKQYEGRWSKGLAAPFIDARLVAERLNDVVGPDWGTSYGPLVSGAVVCRLEIMGTIREDVGFTATSDEMGVKGAYSDALKRAAVQFGIGASLYATPKQFLAVEQLDRRGPHFYLSRAAERLLAGGYASWLTREDVVKRFGQPIDHGDTEPEPEPEDAPEPEPEGGGHDWNGAIHRAWTTSKMSLPELVATIDALAPTPPPHASVEIRIARLSDAQARQLLARLESVGEPTLLPQPEQGSTAAAIEGA